MSTQQSRHLSDRISIPSNWDTKDENTISTCIADVLLTGPSPGEYLSLKVKKGERVFVLYRPTTYNKTRVSNPSYGGYYSSTADAISDINAFFNGADPSEAFNRSTN